MALASENLDNHQRPKITLVLAGGGVKGTAHVTVLKVLKEYRIPIDFVTGFSIGSVVGGLYALCPALIGYGATNDNNQAIYLCIGKSF